MTSRISVNLTTETTKGKPMTCRTLTHLRTLALVACGCFALVTRGTAATAEQGTTLPLKNTGMEEGQDIPAAWQKGPSVAGVELTWDRTIAHQGKASLCLKKTAQRYFPIASWNQIVALEPADQARKLRVRCWVKAQAVTKAIVDVPYALSDAAQRAGHVWAIYVGQKQPTDPMATHDWKLYEATVQVPAKASTVGLAFQIYGPGTVWFDDLEAAWVD